MRSKPSRLGFPPKKREVKHVAPIYSRVGRLHEAKDQHSGFPASKKRSQTQGLFVLVVGFLNFGSTFILKPSRQCFGTPKEHRQLQGMDLNMIYMIPRLKRCGPKIKKNTAIEKMCKFHRVYRVKRYN
jgi:hypothetical protein